MRPIARELSAGAVPTPAADTAATAEPIRVLRALTARFSEVGQPQRRLIAAIHRRVPAAVLAEVLHQVVAASAAAAVPRAVAPSEADM